jgi:hypothetical protein
MSSISRLKKAKRFQKVKRGRCLFPDTIALLTLSFFGIIADRYHRLYAAGNHRGRRLGFSLGSYFENILPNGGEQ